MTCRKERKKKIQLDLWVSNPQPLAYMDKGTTTCAKGEPEVIGHGSGAYPVEEHCSFSCDSLPSWITMKMWLC